MQTLDAEIWVVDNNSSDGSVTGLQPLFPQVKWIVNTTNPGFAKANNQALRQCSGDFVLFLNPDTLLPTNCLSDCLKAITTNEAAALGIRMIDGGGQFLPESKRGFPSPIASFFKLTGLASLFPTSSFFNKYYLGHLSPLKTQAVEVLAGAFILANSQVVKHCNGFDEIFFMYGEDIDLSYRMLKCPPPLPHINLYFADNCIVHFKGESTKKGNLNYVRIFYGAMILFVQKHFNSIYASWYKTVIFAAIGGVSALASARRLFSIATPSLKNNVYNLGIIGSALDFLEIETIMCKAGKKTAGIHPIRLHDCPDKTQPNFSFIASQLKKLSITHLVLCISIEFPITKAMQCLQSLPEWYCLFHYRGSQSIVGSHSSHTEGISWGPQP